MPIDVNYSKNVKFDIKQNGFSLNGSFYPNYMKKGTKNVLVNVTLDTGISDLYKAPCKIKDLDTLSLYSVVEYLNNIQNSNQIILGIDYYKVKIVGSNIIFSYSTSYKNFFKSIKFIYMCLLFKKDVKYSLLVKTIAGNNVSIKNIYERYITIMTNLLKNTHLLISGDVKNFANLDSTKLKTKLSKELTTSIKKMNAIMKMKSTVKNETLDLNINYETIDEYTFKGKLMDKILLIPALDNELCIYKQNFNSFNYSFGNNSLMVCYNSSDKQLGKILLKLKSLSTLTKYYMAVAKKIKALKPEYQSNVVIDLGIHSGLIPGKELSSLKINVTEVKKLEQNMLF